MVATHTSETLLLGNTHIHVAVFCPLHGGRIAGLYTVLYVGKKENENTLSTVHNEDTEVNVHLKVRTIGSPFVWYMHNGGQVLDLRREVQFLPCAFAANGYVLPAFAAMMQRKSRKRMQQFVAPQQPKSICGGLSG